MFNLTKSRCPPQERDAKATKVTELAKKFVMLLPEQCTDDSRDVGTYYTRVLMRHIRGCPVDLVDASGSAMEQVNQDIKKIIR